VKQINGQPPIQVDLTLKFGETRWPTSETNLDPKLGNKKKRKLPSEQTLNCKTSPQSDEEKARLAIFSFKNVL